MRSLRVGLAWREKPAMCLDRWGFVPSDISPTLRSLRMEFKCMASDGSQSCPCNWTPVKSTSELPSLAIPYNVSRGYTSLGMAESSHPRLSQCLTLHFSCFASFCYNNTVIISIAIFWGLWVILVNYQTWGSSGNPWVCRHLVRSWGTLGTSKLVTDVWGEGGLMEDCELNLWSLAQLQVVGIRSLCTHSQESSVSESEDRDESEKAKVKTIRSKPYFIFPTEAPIFSKLWPSKNPHQWHLL